MIICITLGLERCHVGCMSTYCCCDKSVPDLVEKQKKMIDVDTKVAQKSRTIHSSILEDHAIIIIMSCCSWFFVCISYRIMHWKRNNALEYLLKCKRQFSSWTLDPIFSHAILTTSQHTAAAFISNTLWQILILGIKSQLW